MATEVYLIAYTTVHIPWHLQWEDWPPNPGPVSDAETLTEFAGRMCYRSWANPAQRTNAEYIANILQHEHGSVLEHASATFALLEVSRAFTHELVRHRHLSFSQESQRFVGPRAISYVIPPLFQGDAEAESRILDHARDTGMDYDYLVQRAEALLKDQGVSKTARRKRAREAARAVLPNATPTNLVVTGNHRAWREVLLKRGSPHADAEMRQVILEIYTQLRAIAPAIYADIVREVIDGSDVLVRQTS